MRVLGIDCGSERTGFGVIESDGVRHRIVIAGVIRTRPKDPMSERLLLISQGLMTVIRDHQPECGAVEDVFHAINARSALKLAHVRGVALLALAQAGLPCGEYSPATVKMSVVGHGRAEKSQVQMMIRTLCGRDEKFETVFATYDASDAVAVAICHATHLSTKRLMGAAAV